MAYFDDLMDSLKQNIEGTIPQGGTWPTNRPINEQEISQLTPEEREEGIKLYMDRNKKAAEMGQQDVNAIKSLGRLKGAAVPKPLPFEPGPLPRLSPREAKGRNSGFTYEPPSFDNSDVSPAPLMSFDPMDILGRDASRQKSDASKLAAQEQKLAAQKQRDMDLDALLRLSDKIPGAPPVTAEATAYDTWEEKSQDPRNPSPIEKEGAEARATFENQATKDVSAKSTAPISETTSNEKAQGTNDGYTSHTSSEQGYSRNQLGLNILEDQSLSGDLRNENLKAQYQSLLQTLDGAQLALEAARMGGSQKGVQDATARIQALTEEVQRMEDALAAVSHDNSIPRSPNANTGSSMKAAADVTAGSGTKAPANTGYEVANGTTRDETDSNKSFTIGHARSFADELMGAPEMLPRLMGKHGTSESPMGMLGNDRSASGMGSQMQNENPLQQWLAMNGLSGGIKSAGQGARSAKYMDEMNQLIAAMGGRKFVPSDAPLQIAASQENAQLDRQNAMQRWGLENQIQERHRQEDKNFQTDQRNTDREIAQRNWARAEAERLYDDERAIQGGINKANADFTMVQNNAQEAMKSLAASNNLTNETRSFLQSQINAAQKQRDASISQFEAQRSLVKQRKDALYSEFGKYIGKQPQAEVTGVKPPAGGGGGKPSGGEEPKSEFEVQVGKDFTPYVLKPQYHYGSNNKEAKDALDGITSAEQGFDDFKNAFNKVKAGDSQDLTSTLRGIGKLKALLDNTSMKALNAEGVSATVQALSTVEHNLTAGGNAYVSGLIAKYGPESWTQNLFAPVEGAMEAFEEVNDAKKKRTLNRYVEQPGGAVEAAPSSSGKPTSRGSTGKKYTVTIPGTTYNKTGLTKAVADEILKNNPDALITEEK